MVNVVCLDGGQDGSNCFILAGMPAIVIDPGLNPGRVVKSARELHINAVVFINTHCHYDHAGCVPELRKRLGGEYMIHDYDADAVENGVDERVLAGLFGSRPPVIPVSRRLADGDVIRAGGCSLEVVHTPGHTPGSICLYEPVSRSLFTGDTVFADGVGRTNFPGGSSEKLGESIRRLAGLKEKRGVEKVYPGHGPVSDGGCIDRAFDMFFG
ncbi:MAG: MBL fold metallo-hydrolase [Candidatus Altiarchaeota archaeon]|nr:MBL fold metallo-hydrolase [Candidatus Altiarchaeota archaeon]